MKPVPLALLIASSLLTVSMVGIIAAVAPAGPFAGADESLQSDGVAGDHAHDDLGMERPHFPLAAGTTPTAETAQSLDEVHHLLIEGDDEFVPANGVRSGSGSLEDPYIISGYYVAGDLYIRDTDACFVVKENYIGGQLTLNWNGQCAHVHHNHIEDLRVNENVRRTGYATGGLLEQNSIEFIGQLRHYDGEFRHNVIGPYSPDSMWDEVLETVPWMFDTDPRVANIDGFNQGLIHHNTFYGSVDLDLHGHHHGTGFFAPHSHYHGSDEEAGMPHDHTERWTSVAFTENKIVDPEGYGLRYEDRNHAGDDRTANSEDNEDLNLDHTHYTHIAMNGNVIDGGQLWVDIFNADDRNHHTRNPGTLEIRDNQVSFNERVPDDFMGLPFFGAGHSWSNAISVFAGKEMELAVTGNTVVFEAAEQQEEDGLDGVDLWPFDDGQDMEPTAVRLERINDAAVTIEDNVFENFHYGIRAADMDADTRWSVSGNDYGDASQGVYYDESVENQPTGSDV